MNEWLVAQLTPLAPGFWLLIGLLTTALLLSSQAMIAPVWRTRLWAILWLMTPYLGLLSGGLSPRLIGLSGIDWTVSLGLGLGIVFAVILLLTLVRTLLVMGEAQSTTGAHARHNLGNTILWSGLTQFHWSFLRGAVWESLLTLPNPPELPGYWAVWIAAGLVVAQLLWARPGFAVLLVQLAILTTTSILFFYTHNFWLCWVLHVAVQLIAAPSLAPLLTPGRAGVAR